MNKIQDSVSKWFHAGEVVVIEYLEGRTLWRYYMLYAIVEYPYKLWLPSESLFTGGEESDRDEKFCPAVL